MVDCAFVKQPTSRHRNAATNMSTFWLKPSYWLSDMCTSIIRADHNGEVNQVHLRDHVHKCSNNSSFFTALLWSISLWQPFWLHQMVKITLQSFLKLCQVLCFTLGPHWKQLSRDGFQYLVWTVMDFQNNKFLSASYYLASGKLNTDFHACNWGIIHFTELSQGNSCQKRSAG